jgi:hypothetical protein
MGTKSCSTHPNTTQKATQTKKPAQTKPLRWDGKKPTTTFPTKKKIPIMAKKRLSKINKK